MNTFVLVVIGLLIAIAAGLIIRLMMRRRESLRAVGREAEEKRVVAQDTLRAGWFSAAHSDSDSGWSSGGDGGGDSGGGSD